MLTKKIHLDTDLGGDIDDLCALALLLARPDVEISGITTAADDGGRRCGYVRYVLDLAGRSDIPVFAGADVSLGCFRYRPTYPNDAKYWPEPIAPSPNPLEDALRLLEQSIEAGATVIAIGPYTNLALLDRSRPGLLDAVPLYLMGFHVRATPDGFPSWGIDMDYNVQMDVASAQHLLQSCAPIVIPIEMTLQTALRRSYLPGLRQASPVGALLALQAEAFAHDEQNEARFGQTCFGLPNDTINFLHDPLACAVALGWNGVEIEEILLRPEISEAGYLKAANTHDGKPTLVVTRVDGNGFNEWWYHVVAGLQ